MQFLSVRVVETAAPAAPREIALPDGDGTTDLAVASHGAGSTGNAPLVACVRSMGGNSPRRGQRREAQRREAHRRVWLIASSTNWTIEITPYSPVAGAGSADSGARGKAIDVGPLARALVGGQSQGSTSNILNRIMRRAKRRVILVNQINVTIHTE